MKRSVWIILFAIDAIVELIAVQLNNETIQFIAKPLLIILLGAYFISSTGNIKSPLKKWIMIALFFSWAGDVVLMFQEKDSIYFMLGLVSLLFVISDSILAINKFYRSFEMAGIIIILTYVLAQFFIIEGAKRYITSAHKE